jgi:transcriptional regulator GlxA family with amidase domain
MHTVAILALDGVIPFDLATPLEVFGRARLPDGRAAYRVRVCAPAEEIDAGSFKLRTAWDLDALADADTIIVPGIADPRVPIAEDVLLQLQVAASRGTRIASICVGAFTLAASGLLNGLRATTHWAAATEFARQFPQIEVDANVLFVDNGQILTSAGAAAGLDLCLYLIRRDYGSAVAAHAARTSVMPLERTGGQAQFIVHVAPASQSATLEPLLRWMEEHARRPLSLAELAAQTNTSIRTLSRRFMEQTGTTPLHWLNHCRIRQAQALLETTDHTVERIAEQTGFGSATTFRDRFKRLVGISPQAYRRSFRGRDGG